MPVYVGRWIKTGLDTNPINLEAARRAVIGIYQNVGETPPERIHFATSPEAGYKLYKELGGTNRENFFSGIFYGNNEAHWLAFYQFMRDEVNLSGLDQVVPLIEAAEQCGWIYCGDTDAIVMDRPSSIKMDEDKRLHCENGPAIRYADGFAVYSWHGVRIPAQWIEDKGFLTAKMALGVQNVEQRRAACEILGWNNIIEELGGVVIDKDEDPMIGTLMRVVIPDIGPEQFLRVLCGTGREFAIPVPPTVRTALEANAWTFGVEPEVLRDLEVRT